MICHPPAAPPATPATPQHLPGRTLERRVLAAFAAAALVVLALAATTWKVLHDAEEAARRVARTNEVLARIASLREATFLIESLTRGYLLSGGKEQLAERAAIVLRRAVELQELAELTADNPRQQALLRDLRVAADARRALAERSVTLRDSVGFEAAAEHSASAPVRETRETYVRIVNKMKAEEIGLLTARAAEQQRARDVAFLTGAGAVLVTLTLLAAALLMIRRQLALVESSRQHAEQANADLVQAKEAADHANAAKDVFLATMSHEIRTPLSGLLGMLELLALSRLDREQTETLMIARDSGRAMGRIIDDILDHAKIAAGKLDVVQEPVSIAQLLPRIVNTHYAVASAKGLLLRQITDPRISPMLLADSLRLLQVLGNFVSNALKFTSDGYVEVRADLVKREGLAETLQLSVRDTGIGMSSEQQSRLFLPFEQASVDTARLYGGSGLGLSISQRLAELMGGSVSVQSVLGAGTTMTLTLTLMVTDAPPAAIAASQGDYIAAAWRGGGSDDDPLVPQTEISAAAVPGEAPAGAWVLAVDDSPVNRLLIARQLRLLGMRVQTAADGHEAFELWRHGQFDLVITDLNMPVMDGYELAAAIRTAEAAAGLARKPVLAWTANAMADSIDKCHAVGLDDVLTKPADIARLKAMLARWLLPDRQGGDAGNGNAPATAAVSGKPEGLAASAASATSATTAAPAPAAAPPRQAPALDLRALEALADGDAEAHRDLVRATSDAMRKLIPEVTAALASDDRQMIEAAGHKLKGSAGMCGAHQLAAVCAEIESAAAKNDASRWPALRSAFVTEAQRVLAAFDALAAAGGRD